MNTDEVLQTIWERKMRFIAVFFLIFTITYAFLYVIDFLPEAPSVEVINENETELDAEGAIDLPPATPLETASSQALGVVDVFNDNDVVLPQEELPVSPVEDVPDVTVSSATVLPTSLYIERLDKTIQILNPQSRTIKDLDEALLDGAVRHPDSATLNQEGNVFILGHSSYLPNVRNKNFQAFNGIEYLAWGDTIEVVGGDKTYVYRVEKVYKAKASEVTIPIANTGNMLTLATCNSFGSTDDRHIVEASLVNIV